MATVEFIKKRITGKENEIAKLEKKLERIHQAEATNWEKNPYYYSERDINYTVDEAVIKSLQNNALKTSKALNYAGINCTDSKVVYAYPKSQGLLRSVLDGNGFDYIDSYDCMVMTVNNVSYYVYVMLDPTTLDGFMQKFS